MKKQFDNIYMKRFLYFNVYVIKGEDGDILIDTGFIGMKRRLKRWLDKFNIKLVILTHAHVDHIWNTSYIKKRYNCQVSMSELDIENIDNSKIKSKPKKEKYNTWTKVMNFGMKTLTPKSFDIDIPLTDNQTIRKHGIDLKIVSLPGHTNGSIGILYKDYLFAGDALVYRKKQAQIAFQNQNTEEAIKSYEKLKEINPKIILIGHDKVVTKELLNYQ